MRFFALRARGIPTNIACCSRFVLALSVLSAFLNTMESITLKCFICPKNPIFSDVSHLLTHISSKGHLSHQFKLKVRSQQEPEIEEQLANYDHWYNHFELGRLLSERMVLKDSKKTGTRSRARKSDTARGRSKGTKKAASNPASTRENPDDVLDPRLTQTQFNGQKVSEVCNLCQTLTFLTMARSSCRLQLHLCTDGQQLQNRVSTRQT